SGTYQHFTEGGARPFPTEASAGGGGKHFPLSFEGETAGASLDGPVNGLQADARSMKVDFLVHRDRAANAAVVEVQGKKILLKAGQWSRWAKLEFKPGRFASTVTGIVRFYLQEVAPTFRLYVSPINFDPSA